jgi:hypothetical protein
LIHLCLKYQIHRMFHPVLKFASILYLLVILYHHQEHSVEKHNCYPGNKQHRFDYNTY